MSDVLFTPFLSSECLYFHRACVSTSLGFVALDCCVLTLVYVCPLPHSAFGVFGVC